MSTNPFDDDHVVNRGISGRSKQSSRSQTRSIRTSSRQQPPPAAATASSSSSATVSTITASRDNSTGEPAIWAARNVEWPIPSSLSLANYQKLIKVDVSHHHSNYPNSEHTKDGDETSEQQPLQNYYGIAGLMSRVLNTAATTSNDDLPGDSATSNSSTSTGARPLRPPRPRCVATSNGWIVSVLECTGSSRRSIVSRWNVRRGSSASSDPWMALPGSCEIHHVFVDPTGCHTLLSANNGEAYYLHSSSRSIVKLFINATAAAASTLTSSNPGVSATTAALANQPDTAIQIGLTRGSFITAVAWDKEKGTEGSTRAILLGTSLGELYECTLDAAAANSSHHSSSSSSSGTSDLPLLLHKLHSAEASPDEVAPVTGVHFERVNGGMVILVATSGRHKRTRLFSFHSIGPKTTFRTVLSSHTNSLVELPGSVEFADLRICNDHFALRTATGIYYGTVDRNTSMGTNTGAIVDAGMLPYDVVNGNLNIPVSIALTPHHLITLSEANEVRFINRVAQKVIQKERVDWISMSGPTLDEAHMSVGELMMDIRRPDQVWLRKARSLVHISSSCEDRDVWKFTLAKCLEMPQSTRGGGGPSMSSRGVLGRPDFSRQTSSAPTIPALTEEEKTQEAMFEHAKSLCTNTVQKAVVTAVRAEYHLSQGRTELAAKYLAQCPPSLAPFADTSIRLALPMLGIDDPQSYGYSAKAKKGLSSNNLALITYLGERMRVGKLNDDGMVCTMIGAWLAELYLHERERSHTSTLGLAISKKTTRAAETTHQALLHQFLTNHVNTMDAKTIMRILTSHDVSAAECASFAAASGDIGTAVNAALGVGNDEMTGAHDALRILNDAAFELAEPFYYKHAPTLLARAPMAASKSFLSRYSQGLSPTKLLPSIMHYEKKRADRRRAQALHGQDETKSNDPTLDPDSIEYLGVEGSRSNLGEVEVRIPSVTQVLSFVDDESASMTYLEGVIKLGCRSSAIYTYLVSLYTAMDDEEPLFRFLSTHVPAAATVSEANKKTLHASHPVYSYDDHVSSPLDMSYALRTILATGRHFRSAIKLYMGFGMRQQAVELALNVDPVLAREMARESVDGDERKRLWLMIARNATAGGDSRGGRDVVAKVVSVLRDCGPDVLSIEDVLPFLPDFAQIDQIKDEICDALTSYSSKIEGFLKEMNECDQTCDIMREEISRLRSHRMQMRADARCALTNKLVLNAGEPFYVFPSGYVIVESALKKEVLPYLNAKQRARVAEIEKSMGELQKGPTVKAMPENEVKLEALQSELDGLIAAECPLTGSIIVDSIDRGFDDCKEADEMFPNHDKAWSKATSKASR